MMTLRRSFHITAFLCNWAFASAFLIPDDGVGVVYDAPMKKFEHYVEDRAESNDWNKCSTSDCIYRQGRSLPSDNENDSNVSRRWKPSDVVIRFGRSNVKPSDRAKSNVNFIRFGRSRRTPYNPVDHHLSAACAFLAGGFTSGTVFMPRVMNILRRCATIGKDTRIDNSRAIEAIGDDIVSHRFKFGRSRRTPNNPVDHHLSTACAIFAGGTVSGEDLMPSVMNLLRRCNVTRIDTNRAFDTLGEDFDLYRLK